MGDDAACAVAGKRRTVLFARPIAGGDEEFACQASAAKLRAYVEALDVAGAFALCAGQVRADGQLRKCDDFAGGNHGYEHRLRLRQSARKKARNFRSVVCGAVGPMGGAKGLPNASIRGNDGPDED